MVKRKVSQVGDVLRQGVRELPENAGWVWSRVRALVVESRSRAATLIARRPVTRAATVDFDNMTKTELMELAREQQITGRSSMTKAQLAAALARPPQP
jgi:hypothetical protein